MAFLVGSMNIQVYTDSAQTNFPQQIILNEQPAWTSQTVSQVQTSTVTIAASGSQSINLNGLSAVTGMYVYSNTTNVSINMNGLGGITFQAGVPGFIPATITSLSITNSSSTMATTVTVALIAA